MRPKITLKNFPFLILLVISTFSHTVAAHTCGASSNNPQFTLDETLSQQRAVFSADSSEFASAIWFETGAQSGAVTVIHTDNSFDSVGKLYDAGLNQLAFNDDGLQANGSFRLSQVTVEPNQSYCIEIQRYSGAAGPFSGEVEVTFFAESQPLVREFPDCAVTADVFGYFPSKANWDAVYSENAIYASYGVINVEAPGQFSAVQLAQNADGTQRSLVAIPTQDAGTRFEIASEGRELAVGQYCLYGERSEMDARASETNSVELLYAPTENIFFTGGVQILSGDGVSYAENAGSVVQEISLIEPLAKDIQIDYELGASTATEDLDFTIESGPYGTLTIPAGEVSVKITLNIIDDSIQELDEQIEIKFAPTYNYFQYFGKTVVVIQDDDAPTLENRAPQFSGANFPSTAQVGTLYSYTVTATDLDGDLIAYQLENQPAWMTINSETGLISGTPSVAGVVEEVRVIALDGAGGEAVVEFSFTVNRVEDDPLEGDNSAKTKGGGGCSVGGGTSDSGMLILLMIFSFGMLYRRIVLVN